MSAHEADRGRVNALLQTALAHQSLGEWAAADGLLHEASALAPRHSQIYYLQALGARACGERDRALACVTQALAWQRLRPEPFVLAGRLLLEAGDPNVAVACFNQALGLAPGDAAATSGLADALAAPVTPGQHAGLAALCRPVSLAVCVLGAPDADRLAALQLQVDEVVFAAPDLERDRAANAALAQATSDWVLVIESTDILQAPPGALARCIQGLPLPGLTGVVSRVLLQRYEHQASPAWQAAWPTVEPAYLVPSTAVTFAGGVPTASSGSTETVSFDGAVLHRFGARTSMLAAAPASLPTDEQELLRQALGYLNANQPALAEGLLATRAERTTHPQVPYLRAEAAWREGRDAEGVGHALAAVRLDPTRLEPWLMAAWLLYAAGDGATATACLQRASSLDPSSTLAARLLALLDACPRATASLPEVDELLASRETEVSWTGILSNSSGYGSEALGMLEALDARGIKLAIRSVGSHEQAYFDGLPAASRAMFRRMGARHAPDGAIHVTHCMASAFELLRRPGYNIGRTMFETDGLPADWVAACNRMDELWLPGAFNRETFRAAGVTTQIVEVPGGIDAAVFHPDVAPWPIADRRGTVFLSIFGWSLRKGWDVLLAAWAQAFGPQDDVMLVLRCFEGPQPGAAEPGAIDAQINAYLLEDLGKWRDEVAPIKVLIDTIPADALPRLYAAADAYVSPSRGEGWGRPQMEAMACGLPVIATRWSGNMAFMHDENSLLLDVEALVPVDERLGLAHFLGQRWAEPSVPHLVELLRQVVAAPEAARALGRVARAEMVRDWGWQRAATIMAQRLEAIPRERAGKGT